MRLGSLGDIVHTLPAVALLRTTLPNAFIGWIVEEHWAPLLCSRPEFQSGDAPLSSEKPLVNAVHTVRTKAWRRNLASSSTRQQVVATVRSFRAMQYDVALDFQSAIRSAVLGRLAQPQQLFGFAKAHEAPASLLYSRRIEARGRHMVEQNASLSSAFLRDCQAESAATHENLDAVYNFPLPDDRMHDSLAAAYLSRLGISDFCLLNAGAGWGAKMWPAERWAQVAGALAEQGLRSIVNHGPGEAELARNVEHASGGAAVAVSSTIGELIALARRARLCIGGDTGPTHLAAALGVPVVGIYGPTDPARNGPFAPTASNTAIVTLRSETSITDHARRREPEAGLLRISPQQVIDAAMSVLAQAQAAPRA